MLHLKNVGSILIDDERVAVVREWVLEQLYAIRQGDELGDTGSAHKKKWPMLLETEAGELRDVEVNVNVAEKPHRAGANTGAGKSSKTKTDSAGAPDGQASFGDYFQEAGSRGLGEQG